MSAGGDPPPDARRWMREAAALAQAGMRRGDGGPFGAVIVRNGDKVGAGSNRVLAANDPTAHAEIVAIRAACSALGRFDLDDCVLYASCEPCPMCLGAVYWARIPQVLYASTRSDAADAGFDDEWVYRELARSPDKRAISMIRLPVAEADAALREWLAMPDRTRY